MKKIISLIFVALFIIQCVPAIEVIAVDVDQSDIVETQEQNDVIDMDEVEVHSYVDEIGVVSSTSDAVYGTTIEELADGLRERLKAKQEIITVYYTDDIYNENSDSIFDLAVAHTGNPEEGDYLYRQIRGISQRFGSNYITYEINYDTTSDQEKMVADEVSRVLSEIITDGMTDYQKVEAIYDYICSNVSYDYEHLEDSSYKLKYTAYAALINKTAVCEGYTLLFYRMALEVGVDTRFISGVAGVPTDKGPHSWNIVELDGLYYNLDTTWDAGKTNYGYFLESNKNFSFHYPDEEYLKMDFISDYPISTSDYLNRDPNEKRFVISGTVSAEKLDKYFTVRLLDSEKNEITKLYTDGSYSFFDIAAGEYMIEVSNNGLSTEYTEVTVSDSDVQVEEIYLECLLTGECGDGLIWSIDAGTGTLNITYTGSGTGEMTNFEWLTSGPWGAFEGLRKCIIGEGVTAIGEYAFYQCIDLVEIQFPCTLKSIGRSSFSECSSLIDVKIPDGVTEIGNSAFNSCSGLKSISLPSGLTVLNYGILQHCTSLEEIVLPDSVELICSRAFFKCTEFKKVVLSHNLTEIEDSAFLGCKSLETIVFNDALTTIGSNAFDGCVSLEEIVLPDSVSSIGAEAFAECDNLKTVVLSRDLTIIPSNMFFSCGKLVSVTMKENLTKIGARAFGYCAALEEVICPDSLQSISKNAFENCHKLKRITFSDNLVEIKEKAFYYCDSLTNLELPDSLTSIEACAFYHCVSLESVVLPDSLQIINESTFFECQNLKSVVFPGELTEIKAAAFYDCRSLTGVEFSKKLTTIGNRAFQNCTSIAALVLPNSLTSIGEEAFEGCRGLEKVVFSDTLTEIKNRAFASSRVNKPELPASLTTIGSNIFEYCYSLDYVAFLGDVPDNWGDIAIPSNVPIHYYEGTAGWDSPNWTSGGVTYDTVMIHDNIIIEVASPTCTEQGYTHYSCTICGEVFVEYTDALDHDYSDWYIAVAPSCEDGIEQRDCSRCGYSEARGITGSDHDLILHNKQYSTCTEIGWNDYYTCSKCDYTTYKEIPAEGHYIIVHKGQESTCTEKGWAEYETCGRCNYTTYVELPLKAHSYDAVITVPTCINQGYTTYKCKCGDSYIGDYVDAIGHDIIEHEAKAPTCTGYGWEAYETCSRCDYSTYRHLSAPGHDYQTVVVEPTCTKRGYTRYTCHCGFIHMDDYVEALGHNYSEWYTSKAVTCTSNGENQRKCLRCSHIDRRVIEAAGHSLIVYEEKNPTCTEVGWYSYEDCSNCDYTTYNERPALGDHIFRSYEGQAPTCTDIGWDKYETCVRCGYSTFKELPMIDHVYESGACTMCGEKDPDAVLKGDIDGDGKVNAVDMFKIKLFIKQLLSATDTETIAADVNGDGKLNMVDLFELKYRLVKGVWRLN